MAVPESARASRGRGFSSSQQPAVPPSQQQQQQHEEEGQGGNMNNEPLASVIERCVCEKPHR